MANVIFEIGDSSCDGHNFCAEFMVTVNKSLKELREIHLQENHFIASLCSEYRKNYIYINELYNFLIKRISHEEVLVFLNKFANEHTIEILIENDDDEKVKEISIKEEEYHTFRINEPLQMLHLWLRILKVIDSTLEYKIISEAMSRYFIKYKGYPEKSDGTIEFHGPNEQGCYLNSPGYGVWTTNESQEFCNSD